MERRRFGQHVDALAECAVADLVVVLDEPDEGGRRQVAAGLAALLAAAVARRFALIHEASRERFAEPLDRTLGIVGVVAAGIAGRQMLVDVVDVVIPLRVVKSGCPPIPDQHRGLVAIVFQYEVNVTAGLVRGDARPDGARHLLQQMLAAALLDRSEERRVGKDWVSTVRSRWSQYH